MTKYPIKIEKNTLATKALSIMNEKKITCLCVYDKKKKIKNNRYHPHSQYIRKQNLLI